MSYSPTLLGNLRWWSWTQRRKKICRFFLEKNFFSL